MEDKKNYKVIEELDGGMKVEPDITDEKLIKEIDLGMKYLNERYENASVQRYLLESLIVFHKMSLEEAVCEVENFIIEFAEQEGVK